MGERKRGDGRITNGHGRQCVESGRQHWGRQWHVAHLAVGSLLVTQRCWPQLMYLTGMRASCDPRLETGQSIVR